jgi:hypothetical protein
MFVSSEERMAILKMIENNQIKAEEGLKLLEAMGKEPKPAPVPTAPVPPKPEMKSEATPMVAGNGRYFRVLITNTQTGNVKTRVTLPMSLVNWGLRMGGTFAPEMNGINLEELREILESSEHGGKIVDVLDEEDGEHVEIFID